jgi:hypothetical protein
VNIYKTHFSLFLKAGFSLLALSFVSVSFSQGLINHGAVITLNAVASSAAPYIIVDGGVNGIFTNEADGASQGEVAVFNTGGTMIVPGNWNNTATNSVFNGDGSTVFLNGDNVQRIGPTAGSSGSGTSFTNLTLGGSDVKTLDINTEVGGIAGVGILDLADIVLELNQNTLTVTNPSSGTSATGAIRFTTGAIYSEFESSIIAWNIKTNTGNHIYPFTNALPLGTFIPFELDVTGAGTESVAGTGIVGLSTFYSPGNSVTPAVVTNMLPDEANAADRFWGVTVTGYTSGSEPTADMYFHYDPSVAELAGVPEDSLLAQVWTTNWQPPVGTLVNGSDYVVVPGVQPKTEPWVLANGEDPLPINLLSLNADCEGGHVAIKWSTASENNNRMFTVERLASGGAFVPVDSVPGSGNSYSVKNYSIIDKNCVDKSCYYRLRQADFDGRSTVSKIVAVSCQNNKDFEILSLYSNSGEDKNLHLIINASEDENFKYSLYNSIGQEMVNSQSSVTKGINNLSLEIEGVSQGVYFFVIKSERRMLVKKIPINY